MLSKSLCQTIEKAFQEKYLVEIQYEGEQLVCGLYLVDFLEPATTKCDAIAYICRKVSGRHEASRAMRIDAAKITSAKLIEPLRQSLIDAMQSVEGEIEATDRELEP